jgi:3-deoxy-D-manno-octulosonic-acid transferase
MENFPAVMERFLENNAVGQVENAEQLSELIAGLIAMPEERGELGQRARQVVEENRGVIERTVLLLDRD